MPFEPASNEDMQRLRDSAEEAHKRHWASNSYEPQPDRFGPGFEQGWNSSNAALRVEMQIPDSEDKWKSWADQRAKDCKRDDEDWEWRHGFMQGGQAVEKAGKRS